MPSAVPAAAPAAAVEEAAVEEKSKEKTIFTVKLESFDAAAKPKIIKEVKALVPNLTLMDVRAFVRYACGATDHIPAFCACILFRLPWPTQIVFTVVLRRLINQHRPRSSSSRYQKFSRSGRSS